MNRPYLLAAILLLTCLAPFVSGQSFYAVRRERNLIALGGIGTSTYFGELANPGDYFDARPSITAGLQYYFSNRISARAELSWFLLRGNDSKADAEGLNEIYLLYPVMLNSMPLDR